MIVTYFKCKYIPKQTFCLIFTLLSVLYVNAQNLEIVVNNKGKIGYADQNGTEVIKCSYDNGYPFSNGIAIVMKSGKYGVIDTKGKTIIPIKYTGISQWNEQLFLLKNNKVMGLAHKSGSIVLKPKYSFITMPNCYGRALIAVGGKAKSQDKKTYMANAKYGIIDNSGNVLIEPIYKGLFEFAFDGSKTKAIHEGHRLLFNKHFTTDTLITDCSYLGFGKSAQNISNAGMIDGRGNVIIPYGKYTYLLFPHNNMARFYNVSLTRQTTYGYYDIDNKKEIKIGSYSKGLNEIPYWTHGDFIDKMAPVYNKSWSFVDKNGNTVRSNFAAINHSKQLGLWAAKTADSTWVVFNEQNTDIPLLSGYETITFPEGKVNSQIFSVEKDGKYGCVDKNGNVVVPFKYEMAKANRFDVIAVKEAGNWGIVSSNGKMLVPTKYTDVTYPSESKSVHFWVMKKDSLFYHYNTTKASLSEMGYKSVENFHNGFAFVVPSEINVDNTSVTRALAFVPGTQRDKISSVNLDKQKKTFGYVLRDDDVLIMDSPITKKYYQPIVIELEKFKGNKLSESQKKNILLYVTGNNRFYKFYSTINNTEWDY